jgi:hypothetical protein
MADMPDSSGDSAADDARSETGASEQQDRRQTIDLLRVERGEPERRKLRRWSPDDPTVETDKSGCDES